MSSSPRTIPKTAPPSYRHALTAPHALDSASLYAVVRSWTASRVVASAVDPKSRGQVSDERVLLEESCQRRYQFGIEVRRIFAFGTRLVSVLSASDTLDSNAAAEVMSSTVVTELPQR